MIVAAILSVSFLAALFLARFAYLSNAENDPKPQSKPRAYRLPPLNTREAERTIYDDGGRQRRQEDE
jgi:hypothetical protein